MKKLLFAIAGSLVLAGCGGGQGGFVKACENGLVKSDYDDAAERKTVCTCMYETLSADLSSEQMKVAKKLVSVKSVGELEALSESVSDGEEVGMQLMFAGKACSG